MLGFYISATLIIIILLAWFAVRLIWDVRFNSFQKRNKIKPTKNYKLRLGANIAMVNILLVVGVLTAFGSFSMGFKGVARGSSFKPYEIDNILYKNAKTFESDLEFENLLKDFYKNDQLQYDDSKDMATPEASIAPPAGEIGASGSVSDTYNQVEGISEADIAKVSADGRTLYYGPRQSNKIYKISLDTSGNREGEAQELEFEYFIFNEMLISEKYLIVFGNISEQRVSGSSEAEGFYNYWYYRQSGYKLIDLETFSVVKEAEVEGYIQEVRLVDNVVYILSSRYIQLVDGEPVDMPSYQGVYYFSGTSNERSLTMLTSVNLDTLESFDIGFMGRNNAFYMGHNYIVLANVKWQVFHSNNNFYNKSSIIAIKYSDKGELTYVASTEVEGYVLNQYSIDDYQNYVRLVTTEGRNHKNSVYILERKTATDEFEVVGLLDKGIGKPGEDVKSASFQKDILKVVTYRLVDPLYTIDLSDPKNPIIVSEVEEPGYSSGLVIWDEAGNTIGIGFLGDNRGRMLGYKVSAYKVEDEEPTQSIDFAYDEYGYIWIPATYNQRQHLLVNKQVGLFGFVIYNISHNDPYKEQTSTVMLLTVDFSQENPLIPMSLSNLEMANDIQKIVLVNDYIHILSKSQHILYNVVTGEITHTIQF